MTQNYEHYLRAFYNLSAFLTMEIFPGFQSKSARKP